MKRFKQQVKLADARFYAYHGYYPEEQVLGNEFIVNVEVGFEREWDHDDDIEKTVNYEQLYAITREEMGEARKLLETVAQAILKRIHSGFPFVDFISVRITKRNPPFGGDLSNAEIALTWIGQ